MNRRNFISLLAGTAGVGVVLWRLPERRIFLPSRELVAAEAGWVSRPESVTVIADWPTDPEVVRTEVARCLNVQREFVLPEAIYGVIDGDRAQLGYRFSFTPMAQP